MNIDFEKIGTAYRSGYEVRRLRTAFSTTLFLEDFGERDYSTSTLGHVDDIGVPLVVVYNPLGNTSIPRDFTTLNHEIMHGYGLYHTHRDGGITESQIEFVYPHAFDPPLTNPLDATDNVMSYNSNAITLWRWQQRFINLK